MPAQRQIADRVSFRPAVGVTATRSRSLWFNSLSATSDVVQAFAAPSLHFPPAMVELGTGGKALINTEDALLLLLDHQSGLFETVKDIDVAQLRARF